MATVSNKKKPVQRAPKKQEATALLRADHKAVSELFAEYGNATTSAKKKKLVSKICTELSVHAQVEHATLKELIAQLEGVEPDGEMFDAKIKVLSEYVKHHVKEEQNEMFPKAKASQLDLVELGSQIAERKKEILAQRA